MPKHINRKFVPVGHGGFVVENIDQKKIVFDCGCKSEKLIEQRIYEVFCEEQQITAVFISHFHDDHVNGLHHLLTRCKVQSVVIPYMNPVAKLILLLNTDAYDTFYSSLVLNAPSAIREVSKETRVIIIEEAPLGAASQFSSEISNNRDEKLIRPPIEINLMGADSIDTLHVPFGISCGFGSSDWHFLPYNQSQHQYRAKFLAELAKQGIDPTIVSDKTLTDLLKDPINLKKIRRAYDSFASTKLNITTMTVYSGPYTVCSSKPCYTSKCSLAGKPYKKRGCLYMGDYEANEAGLWDDLKKFYFTYWNDFGIFINPHHGSYKNYHMEMALLDCYHMITANRTIATLKSHHPDIRVTTALTNHYIIDKKIGREINYSGGLCRFTQRISPYKP